MEKNLTDSEDQQKPGILDSIIEILMGVLLVVLPLSLGGVKAWSKEFAVFISGLIVVLFTLKLITKTHSGD